MKESDSQSLEILKSAILLEKRGHAFYSKMAEMTTNSAAKEFFLHMASDEALHVEILSNQFIALKNEGKFVEEKYAANHSVVNEVLSETIKASISASSYEAAAISSAIDFEKRAMDLYSKRAKEASNKEEKQLYTWLSEFEMGHLDKMVKLDEELREKVWNDQSFWPM
ncbi:MAG: ferritin family protein [Oligoflexia bacterium]|nr:ferritin family protein [Oligoflexia bacterium]MBF0365429.1 ferritin family protein [Oligoflexia bacterium]